MIRFEWALPGLPLITERGVVETRDQPRGPRCRVVSNSVSKEEEQVQKVCIVFDGCRAKWLLTSPAQGVDGNLDE